MNAYPLSGERAQKQRTRNETASPPPPYKQSFCERHACNTEQPPPPPSPLVSIYGEYPLTASDLQHLQDSSRRRIVGPGDTDSPAGRDYETEGWKVNRTGAEMFLHFLACQSQGQEARG